MTPEIRKKLKLMSLRAKKSLASDHHGAYLSQFRGSGMEFDEFRAYEYGDDIKHIDWRVTARSRKPYIRMFKEERDVCVAIMIDVSSSMYFGSEIGEEKITKATEIASYIVTLASLHQDRTCLFLFAENQLTYVPPRRGEAHAHGILAELLAQKEPLAAQTALDASLTKIHRHLKRSGVGILISDFYDSTPYRNPLKAIAHRHDLICLRIRDPKEIHPPRSRFFSFIDPETGTSHRGLEQNGSWTDQIRGLGLFAMEVSTASSALDVLTAIMNRSTKQRPRPYFKGR